MTQTVFQPAPPHVEMKTRLAAAVGANRDEIIDLSHRIHANPEVAFEEHQAAAWVAEAIARHGFAVEHPAGRLATAVRGTLRGGKGGAVPRIGILAEYDALPGLGHGCGHNTMAASGVAAGTTGGTRMTELCRPGIGKFSAAILRYLLREGIPHTKMKIDDRMKGDQAFSTTTGECRRA